MKISIGNRIFRGACWALRLGALAAQHAHLIGLDGEHLRDADAELLGLDQRGDELGQVGDIGAVHHVLQRLAARPADPHLGHHARQLGAQRVVRLLDHAGHRRVEDQAGLDANHE